MNKKNNNKGFTLAELLIVVAIIAVLVAIAIPVFTTQLEKSREATDMANARSAYAQLITDYLADSTTVHTVEVQVKQTKTGWNYETGVIGTDITSASGKAANSGGASTVQLWASDKNSEPTQSQTMVLSITTEGVVSCSYK